MLQTTQLRRQQQHQQYFAQIEKDSNKKNQNLSYMEAYFATVKRNKKRTKQNLLQISSQEK